MIDDIDFDGYYPRRLDARLVQPTVLHAYPSCTTHRPSSQEVHGQDQETNLNFLKTI